MKRYVVAVLLMGFALQAGASEIIPPRIAIKWLVQAAHNKSRTSSVASSFTFDKKKHKKLTPLSRDEQLALLKKLPVDELKFDKNEYALDKGRRFTVRLLAPEKLEFEVEAVELKGEIGPPTKYTIIAIRRTAQRPPRCDSLKATPQE